MLFRSAFKREASNWQIQHGLACTMMEATKAYLEWKNKNPRVPLFFIDILHDATKYICHASYLEQAKEMIDYVMSKGIRLPFEDTAGLRNAIDITYRWCDDEDKVDFDALVKKEITWSEVCQLVPTAEISAQLVEGLQPHQLRPEKFPQR